MKNTIRSAGYLAISATYAGGSSLYGLTAQRAQRVERHARMAAAAVGQRVGQRVGQVARKRVSINDPRATAAFATIAAKSGSPAWSTPV